MNPHPIAEIFPLCTEAELKDMAASIQEHGLRQPIVLLDGQILDGRNRAKACEMAGVLPTTIDFKDIETDHTSPVEFVLDQNVRRRHLSQSQRAAAAVSVLPFFKDEAKAKKAAQAKENFEQPKEQELLPQVAAPAPPQDIKEAIDYERFYGVLEHDGVRTLPASEVPDSQELIQDFQIWAVCGPSKVVLDKGQTMGDFFARKIQEDQSYLTPAGKKLLADGEGTQIDEALNASLQKKGPSKGGSKKSHEKAGDTFKVSGKSVQRAEELKKADPAAFKRVQEGKTTLNAELAKLDKKKKAKEAQEQALEAAMKRIAEICGHSFWSSVKAGDRLAKATDVIKYAGLSDDQMLATRNLIVAGWDLKKAINYKFNDMVRTHRISDLITRTAAQGGHFTFDCDGYRVTCERIDHGPAAETKTAKKKLEKLAKA